MSNLVLTTDKCFVSRGVMRQDVASYKGDPLTTSARDLRRDRDQVQPGNEGAVLGPNAPHRLQATSSTVLASKDRIVQTI